MRSYNNAFAMASMTVKEQRLPIGVQQVRINGQVYARIGGLMPKSTMTGDTTKDGAVFAQYYVVDNRDVGRRADMAHAANKKVLLDQKILDDLATMLNECNALVKRFRYAGDELKDPKLPGFAVDYILALTTAKNKDRREWNRNGPAESAEEIGVLVNDLEDRDVIRVI